MVLFLYMEHCSRIRAHSYHLGGQQTMGDGARSVMRSVQREPRIRLTRAAKRRDMSQPAG
jgi:hypothetical protein